MDIKAGDLICYNAAGQKKKTIGLVLQVHDLGPPYSYMQKAALLIQWGCVGNGLLPRTALGDSYSDRSKNIGPGDIVWHDLGDWFEVVK